MNRTTTAATAIIALGFAAILGHAGLVAYQKRAQQKQVAALVGDTTAKLRQALTAKAAPEVVNALDANLQATKAPRLPELADAAEHYILGAREIARRRVVAAELERRAAASRAALVGHMASARHRNTAWLNDAVALKKRVEAQHYDLGITLKALDELLYQLPDSEKRLVPLVGGEVLLDIKLADAARKQAQADAQRAHDELARVRRLVP